MSRFRLWGGKWKKYTSDALGNLLQVTEPAPEGGTHETYYTYNVVGQLTQVRMPRGSVTQYRTFNYDLTTGRLTSATNPESGAVSYTYNPDGTPLRKTDARGEAVEFSYDNYQRVTQKRTYPWGGSTEDPCGHVDYYYDTNPLETNWPSAWGHLTAARWSAASCAGNQFTESYQYQAGGLVSYMRLRAPILTAGQYSSSNLDASFSYTTEGQVAQINYPTWYNNGTPGQNLSLTYSFDTLGRPVRATDQSSVQWANNATYAPDGAPTAVTFVGTYNPQYGYTYYNETRSYNTRGQLTRMTSGSYADLEYRFSATNNDGRITQEKDWISGKEINYQYDTLGRLTSAATTGSQWGLSFTYDGFGNLTSEVATKGTAPTSYLNYNGTTNRIVTAGYGYDMSGNLTTMPNLTLTYDAESRLTQAVHTTNGTEQYGYDPFGQRVWKLNADGTNEVFFYGVKGELLASFCHPSGYNIQMRQGPMYYFAGRKFWTGNNGANNIGNWEDRLGSGLTGGYTYFPYGDNAWFGQYATYTRDVTNLDYARNRYYSSQIMRFTTADPHGGSLTAPQSLNGYAYTGNDPVNHNDPSGLDQDLIMDWNWSTRNGCYQFFAAGYSIYAPWPDDAGTHFVGSINVYSFAVAACQQGWLSQMFFAGGGGGGGKSGTLITIQNYSTTSTKAVEVQNALRWLEEAIKDDATCNSWLTGNGVVIDELLGQAPGWTTMFVGVGEFPGHPEVNASAGTAGTTMPDGSTGLVVNVDGAFFNTGATIGFGTNIQGGTDAAKAEILIHELGHLTGAEGFLNDGGGNDAAQRSNNALVLENCGQVVSRAAGI